MIIVFRISALLRHRTGEELDKALILGWRNEGGSEGDEKRGRNDVVVSPENGDEKETGGVIILRCFRRKTPEGGVVGDGGGDGRG